MVYALNDLGESIDLIPLSVFNSLSLEKLRPYLVVHQMADRTKVHPEGIIKDVLIKVSKFIISVHLFLLDYDAD